MLKKSCLLLLLELAWFGSGSSLKAQEPQESAVLSPDRIPSNGTVAVVMGKAITYDEVERIVNPWKEQAPEESLANLFWHARRNLAVQALLAQTAEQFADDVSDDEVLQHFSRVLDKPPREISKEVAMFREHYLIRLYLDGRMGQSSRLSGVSPDFADFIRVTPQETRTAYRRYLEEFDGGLRAKLAQFLFPRNTFRDEAGLESAVKSCREALQAAPLDEEALAALAKAWPGCLFRILESSDQNASLRPEIRQFAEEAAVGAVSEPLDLGTAIVVEYLLARAEDRAESFQEYQKSIVRAIEERKRDIVREAVVRELILQADYFPPDLFNPNAGVSSAGE